jgi:hypothetical protein
MSVIFFVERDSKDCMELIVPCVFWGLEQNQCFWMSTFELTTYTQNLLPVFCYAKHLALF